MNDEYYLGGWLDGIYMNLWFSSRQWFLFPCPFLEQQSQPKDASGEYLQDTVNSLVESDRGILQTSQWIIGELWIHQFVQHFSGEVAKEQGPPGFRQRLQPFGLTGAVTAVWFSKRSGLVPGHAIVVTLCHWKGSGEGLGSWIILMVATCCYRMLHLCMYLYNLYIYIYAYCLMTVDCLGYIAD